MKSTIFEGLKERLADIKREEAEARGYENKQITPQEIINQAYRNLPSNPPTTCAALGHSISIHAGVCVRCGHKPQPIADPVGYCSVYGHTIGLTDFCTVCGHKP